MFPAKKTNKKAISTIQVKKVKYIFNTPLNTLEVYNPLVLIQSLASLKAYGVFPKKE